MEYLTYGSVCSGIEAASVAWEPIGWRPAWFAEIEPFPCSVLAHHWPQVANLGDMTAIAPRVRSGEIEAPDILVGGTPCQAFSVAGARAGLADPRGQLTLAYVDLADAIDSARALLGKQSVVTVWENVPGVLSSKDNAFGCFLGALAGESSELQPPGGKWKDAGCVYGPQRAIAWRVLDAQFFGVAQRRRRVFVVASAREGFDPAQVLFEFEGLRRDTAPSRGAGQNATAGTLRSTDGGSDVDHACAGHLRPVAFAENSRAEVRLESRDVQITGALSTGGGKAGQGTPCIAFSCKDYGADAGELSPTLRAMGHGESHANAGGQVAVCVTGDITHTLKAEGFDASEDGTGRGQPIVAVAFQERGRADGRSLEIGGDVAYALTAPSGGGRAQERNVLAGSAVRRLTPRECERLQGFPDDWTAITWRKKPASECPDGPRYKAIGNSKAVPVVRWIGERIKVAL